VSFPYGRWSDIVKKSRVVREPFLHFVLLSVLIFAADAMLRNQTSDEGEIVVTAGRIENLAALFARTWQRAPTESELRALIDSYALEEALFREGIALGVDQGDAVIRRRVRQKMDLLADDLVIAGGVPESELETWYQNHKESYVEPARYSFRQVFFSAGRRGDAPGAEARRVLRLLQSPDAVGSPESLGDPSLLGFRFENYGADAISSVFGQTFASNLATVPIGLWSGPIESTYGQHVVFIEAQSPGRIPPLAEIRDEVERDWRYARSEDARRRFYDEVLAQYEVTIEWPARAGEIEEAVGTELGGAERQ
jgi:hypothetical protein